LVKIHCSIWDIRNIRLLIWLDRFWLRFVQYQYWCDKFHLINNWAVHFCWFLVRNWKIQDSAHPLELGLKWDLKWDDSNSKSSVWFRSVSLSTYCTSWTTGMKSENLTRWWGTQFIYLESSYRCNSLFSSGYARLSILSGQAMSVKIFSHAVLVRTHELAYLRSHVHIWIFLVVHVWIHSGSTLELLNTELEGVIGDMIFRRFGC